MTRKELVKAVALKRGVSKAVASDIINDVTAIIVAEVAAGNPVTVGPTFGIFKPVTRNGIVPGSIPARTYTSKSVKFDISDAFKRVLN